MRRRDVYVLLVLGVTIWLAGTLYYHEFGTAILETTSVRYWSAFVVSPIVSTLLCVAILKALGIPPQYWAQGLLLLAIPGMFGEAAILSNWPVLMSSFGPASGGRYGAFLFMTYGVALTVAEMVTLKARSQ